MRGNSLFGLAVPIFLDMALKTSTLIINTYMVSQVSIKLVGAMAAGNQIFNLFITIFNFLAIGCSVLVSQSIGARRLNLALRAIHVSIAFNAFLGLFSSALIFFFTGFALNSLKVPPDVFNEAYEYLHFMSLALFIAGVSSVLAAVIRVKNLVGAIVVVSGGVNLLIICGNAVALGLIGGVNYGLKGVALSSVVAQSVGMVALAFVMVKIARIHVYLGLFFKFTIGVVKKILKVGLPSAGENLLWLAQYMVAFSFVAMLGSENLSVQAIFFQISSFIFLASSSIALASEIIIGKLVGEGRFNRAYACGFFALKRAIIITLIVLFVVFLLREQIMSALGLDSQIKEIMRPLFWLSLVLESGRGFNIVMVSCLRASGDAVFPFGAGVIFMWGVSLPVGYLLGIHLGYGIVGVWAGFCFDEWLRGAANTYRWVSRKWEKKKLV